MKSDCDVVRVLVFPCGSEIALEIHDALRFSRKIHLIGASSRDDHGKYAYRDYVTGLPYINDAEFMGKFTALISAQKINLIFPTHDEIVKVLLENQSSICAKILSGDVRTASVCRDKALIYSLFSDSTCCPVIFRNLDDIESYPVLTKPRIGEGGKGVTLIASKEQLLSRSALWESNVVMEYLPGPEYSVDCFTDRYGRLRFVGPRTRERTLSGISTRSRNIPCLSCFQEMAALLNSRLAFRGAWFFQAKEDCRGTLKLLECAPRIASSMGLYRYIGVNFPLLTVYDAMDIDVEIRYNSISIEVDRALHSCHRLAVHYESVFIDLDDTLIDSYGKARPMMMSLLYQWRNAGIPVHLITSHKGSVNEALQDACIPRQLFKSIMHLGPADKKGSVLPKRGSIFIDNSFREREAVMAATSNWVFDVDAVSCLLESH